MRILLSRIFLILLAAAAGIGLIFYSDHSLKSYFNNNLQVQGKLQSLQTDLYALEGEILQNGSFLYYNYDNIHHLSRDITRLLNTLKESPHLHRPVHHQSLKSLQQFSKEFDAYLDKLERHLTLNAALKNSIIYIPTLQLRAYSIFDSALPKDQKALLLISHINASIFLAKNAQDPDFLTDIKNYTKQLEKISSTYHGSKKRLLLTLREHLDHFTLSFPDYIRSLDHLLHNRLLSHLSSILVIFHKESALELEHINRTGQWILILYLLSLAIVTYFTFRAYRENRYLRKLKMELEHSLITDTITGLGNRLAFQNKKKDMKHPVLFLINIDRFKHINEFYGTQTGDAVLVKVSHELKRITPDSLHASLFRMGGDDFGILFEKEAASLPLENLLESYHKHLERCSVQVNGLIIDLSFTLGASDQKGWLFETADMALKAAKSSQRKRFAFYTPSIDKREEIAKNIQALRSIRSAIDRGGLLPYFQPLYDLKNRRISKFEALARIELKEEKGVLQPYSFIQAASEAKLSSEITMKIFEETLKIADRYPYDFSVNVAAADITDSESREQILQLLSQYRHLSKHIIFEMLESEDIRDYEATADFIRHVKSYGCRIAIDDFGSGYSNFEKILNLDIDILKVDGSLIRRIDRDRHSEMIVQIILDFARRAGWQTVAEFVHSKAVYDKVSEMGFDYLQGYYIGKPSKELQVDDYQKIIQ